MYIEPSSPHCTNYSNCGKRNAKSFLYHKQKKWPVYQYIKYRHTIATSSLNTKYYGQTHLKVTANILNTKELPSQALNRKETEILL
jgi:hypothetical protein